MKLFFKKVSTLPLTLVGVSPKKARETAWQPLVACAFPGRWGTKKVASRKLGSKASGVPSQSPNGASVSAAASVGDGRSPLGCITRAGRRECPRRGRRGPTRQRPAQLRVPPPSLIPKGGTRFGRGDRKARRKPPWHRRCHQGSRLPPRSALNGAHRAPAPPGEGPPPKNVPPGHF